MFYLYPMDEIKINIKWDYDKFFYERWINEAYNALLENPYKTNNPNEAKFFIVSFTLKCLSFVRFSKTEIEEKLEKLPYWNEGKNHVVFDFTDLPKTFHKNKNLSIFKSAFSIHNYNPKKDISIPQFPRYQLNYSNKNKTILASFKGSINRHPIRKKLLYSSNKNIVIENSDNLSNTLNNNDNNNYLNLLHNSTFTLLPRGNGFALSYRHIECMSCGSIPVIISDIYVLPFSELIDWEKCSIKINENNIENINNILENNLVNVDFLQKNGKEYFEKYLSSTKKIIDTSIEIYINKIKIY